MTPEEVFRAAEAAAAAEAPFDVEAGLARLRRWMADDWDELCWRRTCACCMHTPDP